MGIDTVEMATPAFESFVKEGQSLKAGTKLAKMNLDVIEQAGKNNDYCRLYKQRQSGTSSY